MNARPSKRIARIAAVVVAGAIVGVGGAALVVAADEPSHAPANGRIPADLGVSPAAGYLVECMASQLHRCGRPCTNSA